MHTLFIINLREQQAYEYDHFNLASIWHFCTDITMDISESQLLNPEKNVIRNIILRYSKRTSHQTLDRRMGRL